MIKVETSAVYLGNETKDEVKKVGQDWVPTGDKYYLVKVLDEGGEVSEFKTKNDAILVEVFKLQQLDKIKLEFTLSLGGKFMKTNLTSVTKVK